VTLVGVPLGFGILAFVFRFVETTDASELSPDWPATAAQVMATLLLALALETRFVGTVGLSRPVLYAAATLILGWVAIGMYRACVVAAGGGAFSRFEDAFVAGALTAVTWVVVIAAFVSALDDEWKK
jgi:hypothetical protein